MKTGKEARESLRKTLRSAIWASLLYLMRSDRDIPYSWLSGVNNADL